VDASVGLQVSSVSAPVYALFGTVLGALIGGLATWGLERYRQRTQANAAERLLAIELRNALEATWEIRFDDRWPEGWAREWTAAWQTLRDPLLRQRPRKWALSEVAAACARLDQLQHAVNDGTLARKRLTGPNKLFLWEMQKLLEAACSSLAIGDRDYEKKPAEPTDKDLSKWKKEARELAVQADDTDSASHGSTQTS
jgi:hypothetical protein